MSDTYFEILRSGTNSSIQDKGRTNLYHIGITISGAMDQRIFSISNALVNNNLNEGVIEFAYQGPLLQLKNGSANFVITGNVVFNILRKNSIIEGLFKFNLSKTFSGVFPIIFQPPGLSKV